MKIACISTSRVPSDTANSIQVMKACQALARLGHQVLLLLPGDEPAPWETLAQRYGLSIPFEITWIPSDPRWKRNDFAWKSVRQAAAQNAEIVYTWTGQSAVFALLQKIPVLYEVHDLPTGKLGPLWFWLFLRLHGRKRFLIITRALQAALQRKIGKIREEAVVIAPNGVDLEQYQELPGAVEARHQLGLPEALTVLCSGHLYAGRGADLFLGLAGRFPQASFVWVGGRDEDVFSYRSRAEAQGLENMVFTGFITQRDLPLYQSAADVLIMPYARSIAGSSGGNSVDICSPMKMFDYLAAGRSILSSDLPVIHEVLDENNAVFALPEDLQSWEAALGRLLVTPELRQRLSVQSKQAAKMYTWQVRAERALAGFIIE
jgi:glycosyltransferase involved in cell wall biosynthesis